MSITAINAGQNPPVTGSGGGGSPPGCPLRRRGQRVCVVLGARAGFGRAACPGSARRAGRHGRVIGSDVFNPLAGRCATAGQAGLVQAREAGAESAAGAHQARPLGAARGQTARLGRVPVHRIRDQEERSVWPSSKSGHRSAEEFRQLRKPHQAGDRQGIAIGGPATQPRMGRKVDRTPVRLRQGRSEPQAESALLHAEVAPRGGPSGHQHQRDRHGKRGVFRLPVRYTGQRCCRH